MSGLSFLKLTMIEHIKRCQYPILTYGQSFSDQDPHTIQVTWASSNTFLEENNLPPLYIDFFHKVISMHDVRHVLGIFKCSSTVTITLRSCTSELSRADEKDAELNRQFPFGIDLHKILPIVEQRQGSQIYIFKNIMVHK